MQSTPASSQNHKRTINQLKDEPQSSNTKRQRIRSRHGIAHVCLSTSLARLFPHTLAAWTTRIVVHLQNEPASKDDIPQPLIAKVQYLTPTSTPQEFEIHFVDSDGTKGWQRVALFVSLLALHTTFGVYFSDAGPSSTTNDIERETEDGNNSRIPAATNTSSEASPHNQSTLKKITERSDETSRENQTIPPHTDSNRETNSASQYISPSTTNKNTQATLGNQPMSPSTSYLSGDINLLHSIAPSATARIIRARNQSRTRQEVLKVFQDMSTPWIWATQLCEEWRTGKHQGLTTRGRKAYAALQWRHRLLTLARAMGFPVAQSCWDLLRNFKVQWHDGQATSVCRRNGTISCGNGYVAEVVAGNNSEQQRRRQVQIRTTPVRINLDLISQVLPKLAGISHGLDVNQREGALALGDETVPQRASDTVESHNISSPGNNDLSDLATPRIAHASAADVNGNNTTTQNNTFNGIISVDVCERTNLVAQRPLLTSNNRSSTGTAPDVGVAEAAPNTGVTPNTTSASTGTDKNNSRDIPVPNSINSLAGLTELNRIHRRAIDMASGRISDATYEAFCKLTGSSSRDCMNALTWLSFRDVVGDDLKSMYARGRGNSGIGDIDEQSFTDYFQDKVPPSLKLGLIASCFTRQLKQVLLVPETTQENPSTSAGDVNIVEVAGSNANMNAGSSDADINGNDSIADTDAIGNEVCVGANDGENMSADTGVRNEQQEQADNITNALPTHETVSHASPNQNQYTHVESTENNSDENTSALASATTFFERLGLAACVLLTARNTCSSSQAITPLQRLMSSSSSSRHAVPSSSTSAVFTATAQAATSNFSSTGKRLRDGSDIRGRDVCDDAGVDESIGRDDADRNGSFAEGDGGSHAAGYVHGDIVNISTCHTAIADVDEVTHGNVDDEHDTQEDVHMSVIV